MRGRQGGGIGAGRDEFRRDRRRAAHGPEVKAVPRVAHQLRPRRARSRPGPPGAGGPSRRVETPPPVSRGRVRFPNGGIQGGPLGSTLQRSASVPQVAPPPNGQFRGASPSVVFAATATVSL